MARAPGLIIRFHVPCRQVHFKREVNFLVPGAGVEPSAILKRRKLFIPYSGKTHKNDRNAEVRYTAGTRRLHRFRGYLCPFAEDHHAAQ